MRKGMLQLWADLEKVATDLGITWTVVNARKIRPSDPYVDVRHLGIVKSKGPQVLRTNSTYHAGTQHINMRFQADMTPAFKAGTFAHEIGHHISLFVFSNGLTPEMRLKLTRKEEEIAASLHGYELLYSLTKGRVPLGCVDMLNISLVSYGTGESL